MPEKQKRHPMKPVSELMRGWAEALRGELEQWPGVRAQRSFGMTLLYRGEVIFGALPDTRALHDENAIMLKFEKETPALARRMAADAHFIPGTLASSHKAKGEGRKWRFLRLGGPGDIHAALEWLGEAHRVARKVPGSARARRD